MYTEVGEIWASVQGTSGRDEVMRSWGKWPAVSTRVNYASHVSPANKVTSLNTFTPSHGKTKHCWSSSESIDIKPESCICRSFRDDVSKICDDSFVPRWRKLKNHEHATCYVIGCEMPTQKVTKLVNKASLRDFFALQTKMLSPVI